MTTVQVDISVDDDGAITLTLPPGGIPWGEVLTALTARLPRAQETPTEAAPRKTRRPRAPATAAAEGGLADKVLELVQDEELSPGEIARRLGVDRKLVRDAINALLDAELVVVEGTTNDRRVRAA